MNAARNGPCGFPAWKDKAVDLDKKPAKEFGRMDLVTIMEHHDPGNCNAKPTKTKRHLV
jgi:hypothetical protein